MNKTISNKLLFTFCVLLSISAMSSKRKAEEDEWPKLPFNILSEFDSRMYRFEQESYERILNKEQRKTPPSDRAVCAENSARKKRNSDTIDKWAGEAFNRWRLKLLKANASMVMASGDDELTINDKHIPAEKEWVLCLGPSNKARYPPFDCGAGGVVDELNESCEWYFPSYQNSYSSAHPVMFYAKTAGDLWPGDPADQHRDCALLLAAGTKFRVYHRSEPHPTHRRAIGTPPRIKAQWFDYEHFEDVCFLAFNDKELLDGITALSDRMLGGVSAAHKEKQIKLLIEARNIDTQIKSCDLACNAIPKLGSVYTAPELYVNKN